MEPRTSEEHHHHDDSSWVLPLEIWHHLLSFLSVRDAINISYSCRHLYHAVLESCTRLDDSGRLGFGLGFSYILQLALERRPLIEFMRNTVSKYRQLQSLQIPDCPEQLVDVLKLLPQTLRCLDLACPGRALTMEAFCLLPQSLLRLKLKADCEKMPRNLPPLLQELEIHDENNQSLLARLAEALPNITSLKSLKVDGTFPYDAGEFDLFIESLPQSLTTLSIYLLGFSLNGLSNNGELPFSCLPPNLISLQFRASKIRLGSLLGLPTSLRSLSLFLPATMNFLARSSSELSCLSQISDLELSGCTFTGAAMRRFADSICRGNLIFFRTPYARFSNMAFCSVQRLAGLQQIDISNAKDLLDADILSMPRTLKMLKIDGITNITNRAWAGFFSTSGLHPCILETLSAKSINADQYFIRLLPPTLTNLDISDNRRVSDESLCHFPQALRRLCLSPSQLSLDEHRVSIISERMPRLSVMKIRRDPHHDDQKKRTLVARLNPSIDVVTIK